MEKVIAVTGSRSKKRAVETALREFLRTKRREELAAMIGNYDGFRLTLKDLVRMRRDR
jgi:Arc/MetJ family transcription regulator